MEILSPTDSSPIKTMVYRQSWKIANQNSQNAARAARSAKEVAKDEAP